MKAGYANLRGCLLNNPLGLSQLPEKLVRVANTYLPYSTGIEIECSLLEDSPFTLRETINDICRLRGVMDCSANCEEIRIRLVPGMPGAQGLYYALQIIKERFGLNLLSGIHYHIDFSHYAHSSRSILMQLPNKTESEILKQLDTWGYTGDFNKRYIGLDKCGWVRLDSIYQTIEFRIGEMTFDYSLIMKRILHCQALTKKIKRTLQHK